MTFIIYFLLWYPRLDGFVLVDKEFIVGVSGPPPAMSPREMIDVLLDLSLGFEFSINIVYN